MNERKKEKMTQIASIKNKISGITTGSENIQKVINTMKNETNFKTSLKNKLTQQTLHK